MRFLVSYWTLDKSGVKQAPRRLEAKQIYQGVVASPHAVDAI